MNNSKEVQKWIKVFKPLSNEDLKDLLKSIESDKLGKETNKAKIEAIKTLLL